MENFPADVLEKILDKMTTEDGLNLCNAYEGSGMTDRLNFYWRKRMLKGWPNLRDVKAKVWHHEIKYIEELIVRVQNILIDVIPRYCCYEDATDQECGMWHIINEKPNTFAYTIEILRKIIENKNLIRPTDKPVSGLLSKCQLTWKAIAIKSLTHINKIKLTKEIYDYLILPDEKKLLEIGAMLIAQWAQPHIHINWERDIDFYFDDIIDTVKALLRVKYPDHPYFKKTKEELEKWRMENIPCNQYEDKENNEMLYCLKLTLIDNMHFQETVETKITLDCQLINQVLQKKKGYANALLIIYESVARRMGIKLEPLYLGELCSLRYKTQNKMYIFHNFSTLEWHCSFWEERPVACPHQIMFRCSEFLYHFVNSPYTPPIFGLTTISSLELLVIIHPIQLDYAFELAHLLIKNNMDVTDLLVLMQTIEPQALFTQKRVTNLINILERYHQRTKVVDPLYYLRICMRHTIVK